jgi:hypothetical protein
MLTHQKNQEVAMRVADGAGWMAQKAAEEAQRIAREEAARAAREAAARAAAEAARAAQAAMTDVVERAASQSLFATPAPAPPPPDVQAAADQVRAESDPYQKAEVIQFHLQMHAEDPAWRSEFLREVGPEEMGRAVASVDPRQWSPSGFETSRSAGLLAAASEAYTADELARMLETIPASALAGLVEHTLMTAGNPQVPGTEGAAEQMAHLAAGLGAVADALGPDHPAVAGLLDALAGQPSLEQWGGDAQTRVELAGWLVARSGSDDLKAAFVSSHLPQFDPAAADAPPQARALAMVMGSMEPPSVSLAPLVSADPAMRAAFVEQLVRAGEDSVAVWPFDIGRDVQADVATFLTDVARLNPALYPGHEKEAALLRVEAFRAGVEAIDDPLWSGNSAGLERALANMFAADADTIVGRFADGAEGNALFDPEGRILAQFFDRILFRATDSAAAQIALGAVQGYLGIGSGSDGLADRLAASQGDPAFMASEGNQLATRLGFVMGALYQGANAAMASIDSQRERELKVARVFGALVEEAIDHSPVNKAYDAIKSGSDDHASVEKVVEWLYDTYGPGADHKRDRAAASDLIDGLLNGSMRPFFSEQARQGARPEDWINMVAMINVGVAQADGETEPGFRLSP